MRAERPSCSAKQKSYERWKSNPGGARENVLGAGGGRKGAAESGVALERGESHVKRKESLGNGCLKSLATIISIRTLLRT